jgi:hypothetical protein
MPGTPLLMPGRLLWGTLESIQPGPEDLAQVCIAGTNRLVGAEILSRIEQHVGGLATVANIDSEFHAGGIPA